MAISETTKRVVAQQRQTLVAKKKKNLKDIEGFEAQIAARVAANAIITKEIDALKKDIPDPTPATV